MWLLTMNINAERSLLRPVALCSSHTGKDQVPLLIGTRPAHSPTCIHIKM